jgi:hypothetical protein
MKEGKHIKESSRKSSNKEKKEKKKKDRTITGYGGVYEPVARAIQIFPQC